MRTSSRALRDLTTEYEVVRAKGEVSCSIFPIHFLQKQRDFTLDGESGKVSNLQYLHR